MDKNKFRHGKSSVCKYKYKYLIFKNCFVRNKICTCKEPWTYMSFAKKKDFKQKTDKKPKILWLSCYIQKIKLSFTKIFIQSKKQK